MENKQWKPTTKIDENCNPWNMLSCKVLHPVGGADVERAFSRLNCMLEDNRNFAESNAENYFMCYAILNFC